MNENQLTGLIGPLLSQLGMELEKLDDGIRVVYVVKRRYRFQEPLSIKGADYLSESKIRKVSELKNGDFIDEPILSSKAGKIRDEAGIRACEHDAGE